MQSPFARRAITPRPPWSRSPLSRATICYQTWVFHVPKSFADASGLGVGMGAIWQNSFEYDDHRDINRQHLKQPLLLAAKRGYYTLFRILLDKGASMEQSDGMGRTALHYAAGIPQFSISGQLLETILEQGVDVEAQDVRGCTALHSASSTGSIEAMQVLLDNGADTEARDHTGTTPLVFAILGTLPTGLSNEKVFSLLRRCADANAINHRAETPLHTASEYDLVYSVQALLKFGADIDARDGRGYTPLEYRDRYEIQRNPNHERINELLQTAAAKKTAEREAALQKRTDMDGLAETKVKE